MAGTKPAKLRTNSLPSDASINALRCSLQLSQEPQGFVWEQIGFVVASAPDLINSHEHSKSQSTDLVPKGLLGGPWKRD